MRTPLVVSLLLASVTAAGGEPLHPGDSASMRVHQDVTPDKVVGHDTACAPQVLADPIATYSMPEGAPNGLQIHSRYRFWIQIGDKFVCQDTLDQLVKDAVPPGDIKFFVYATSKAKDIEATIDVIGAHPWPQGLQPIELGDTLAKPIVVGATLTTGEWTPVALFHLSAEHKGLEFDDAGNAQTRWRAYADDADALAHAHDAKPAKPGMYVLEAKARRAGVRSSYALAIREKDMPGDPLIGIAAPADLSVDERRASWFFPMIKDKNSPPLTVLQLQDLFAAAGPNLWVYATHDVVDGAVQGPHKGEPLLVVEGYASGTKMLAADGTLSGWLQGDNITATPPTELAFPAKVRPFDAAAGFDWPDLETVRKTGVPIDDPSIKPLYTKYRAENDRYYKCYTKVLERYGVAMDYDVVHYNGSGHVTSVESLADRARAEGERKCGEKAMHTKLAAIAKQASAIIDKQRQAKLDAIKASAAAPTP